MPTRHLTDPYIKHFENPEKRAEIFDADKDGKRGARGLALRVTPTGHKSFVYHYRLGGRTRRYTIGHYGAWMLADAREKARELRRMVDEGVDPMEEKKKAHSPPELTFANLAKRYRERHLPTLSEQTQYEYGLVIDGKLVPTLGDTAADAIERDQVAELLDSIADEGKKRTAEITRGILSGILSFGVEEGLIKDNIVSRVKSKRWRSETRKKGGRDRVYSEKELGRLWEAFGDEEVGFVAGSLFRVLLLCGQRVGETSRMRWSDLHGDSWHISADEAKNDRAHDVPLSSKAMEVIQGMREHAGNSPYVFESPSPYHHDQPIRTELTRQKKKVREASAVSDFKPHDLRRTVSTFLAKLGVDQTINAKILNHVTGGKMTMVDRIYNRHDFAAEKRKALERWADHLMEIVNG